MKKAVLKNSGDYLKSLKNLPETNVYNMLLTKEQIYYIRQQFYEMNAYLFRNYKKYVVPEKNTEAGEEDDNDVKYLNIKEFITKAKKNDS